MESSQLHKTLIDAITAWDPITDPLSWEAHRFEELAQKVFAYQYIHNLTYRTYCDNRGVTPDTLDHIDEIPAVPTDAFKLVDLFIDAEPSHRFCTSGTTAAERGRHYFATLDVYRASLHPTFLRFCNPARESLRMIVLAPSFQDLPESSLCFMIDEVLARWGDEKSSHFIGVDEAGNWQVDDGALQEALDAACADDVPTMVLGTAFAFAEFFDRLEGSWTLPRGSRLMETGGFKGRSKTISRDELYQAFSRRLGLPRSACLGEYSMTELSSQTYTDQFVAGDEATGHFYAPPWLKIQVVDPISLRPHKKSGPMGLIRFIDLANADSVAAIQTSDRGIIHPDGGLQLLGRAPDAELRGCSLTIEEIVEG